MRSTETVEVFDQASLPTESATHPLVATQITPMHLLQVAIDKGEDLDRLQKLMDLQDRWEAGQARKAYVSAMARFKQNPPEILKGKQVSFRNKTGGLTEYKHATLADVCVAAIKGLADVGISHSWSVEQGSGQIRVTCTLTHEAGHSESVSMHAAADESGNKNAIQAIGSTTSYLQRYTLKMITGLAEADDDDDGKGAADAPPTITEDQAANIEALITEIGINRAKFMEWIRADKIGDIPARAYATVIRELEARRAR